MLAWGDNKQHRKLLEKSKGVSVREKIKPGGRQESEDVSKGGKGDG